MALSRKRTSKIPLTLRPVLIHGEAAFHVMCYFGVAD